MNSKRITLEMLNSYRFLKIPKELIFNLSKYKNLSVEAILLYGLLHDRLELSAKNGWVNENGEIYLKFRKEVVMKLLRVGSKTTITNIFKELKKAELIEENQIGCNKANEIYLLEAEFSAIQINDDEILNLSNVNGSTENGRPESVPLDVQKMYASDTNLTETNLKEDEEVLKAYREVKGRYLNTREKDILKELLKVHSKDLVLKAIDIMTTDAEKITLKYIQTTLEDWKSKGIQTIEQVDKMRKEWQQTKNKAKENRIKAANKPSSKPSTFNSFPQRKEYDDPNYMSDLKKKLLGWDNKDNVKEG